MFKYSYTYDRYSGKFDSEYDLADMSNIIRVDYYKMYILAIHTPVLLARSFALPVEESNISFCDLMDMVKLKAIR